MCSKKNQLRTRINTSLNMKLKLAIQEIKTQYLYNHSFQARKYLFHKRIITNITANSRTLQKRPTKTSNSNGAWNMEKNYASEQRSYWKHHKNMIDMFLNMTSFPPGDIFLSPVCAPTSSTPKTSIPPTKLRIILNLIPK